MTRIPPRVDAPDSTTALLADPYGWISAQCDAFGSNVFRAGIALRETVCLRGRDAAALFYDSAYFRRDGAMPEVIENVLLGQGGVQGLDGAAHRRRKAMFLTLMDAAALARFATLAEEGFEEALGDWEGERGLVLHDELVMLVTRIVFRWAGLPVDEAKLAERVATLAMLYERVSEFGWGHLRARIARRESECWAASLVRGARDGTLALPDGCALARLSNHRPSGDEPLDEDVAAVELLNVLRPTIAVARYVAFAVHALHLHPRAAERVRRDPERETEPFVQEVRRCYPFFPMIAARTREPVRFGDYALPADTHTLLDIPGTNRDPSVWEAPERFEPARFHERDIDPFALITQGGGDHAFDHRCAGERITLLLMSIAVRRFAVELDWTPRAGQDLAIVTEKVPARLASGLVIDGLRRRPSTIDRRRSPSGHRQHDAVGARVERPARVPAGRAGCGLGLTVADDQSPPS